MAWSRPPRLLRLLGGVGVLGSQRLLPDGQRLFVVRPGRFVVAHGLEQGAQVVEAAGRVRVLGSQRLLPDGQRLFVVRPGTVVVGDHVQMIAKAVQQPAGHLILPLGCSLGHMP